MESYEKSYFTLNGDDMRLYMLTEHLKRLRILSPRSFKEQWFTHFEQTVNEYFKKYREDDEYIWVDVKDGRNKLIGFVILSEDNKNLILEHIYIEPSFRPLGCAESTFDGFLDTHKPKYTNIYAFTFIRDRITNDFIDKYFVERRSMNKEIIENTPSWIDKDEQQLIHLFV